MTLADVAILNESFIQYPPADLLVAGYLGYKAPNAGGQAGLQQSRQANSAALKAIPFTTGKMKTLDQMPEYLRSPAKMALIERMKAAG